MKVPLMSCQMLSTRTKMQNLSAKWSDTTRRTKEANAKPKILQLSKIIRRENKTRTVRFRRPIRLPRRTVRFDKMRAQSIGRRIASWRPCKTTTRTIFYLLTIFWMLTTITKSTWTIQDDQTGLTRLIW